MDITLGKGGAIILLNLIGPIEGQMATGNPSIIASVSPGGLNDNQGITDFKRIFTSAWKIPRYSSIFFSPPIQRVKTSEMPG